MSDGRWIELASPTSVEHGTALIMVDAEAGRLVQLRVDMYAGTVILPGSGCSSATVPSRPCGSVAGSIARTGRS